jgi:hypothetical protein
MRAIVNGRECTLDAAGIETVDELLEQLRVYVPPRDVVVGVRLNDVAYDDLPAARQAALPMAALTEVALETRSPEAFAREERSRVADYLAAIAVKFARAVDCFDRDAARDGLRLYGTGAEELGLLIGLWSQLCQLDGPGTAPAESVTRDLETICDELLAAQQRHDMGALRHTVAERLLPALDRWRTACDAAPVG